HVWDAAQHAAQIDVLHAPFDECKPAPPAVHVEVRFLDLARVVIGEAVDAGDARALVEQGSDEVRPDESCRSSDQRLHANTDRIRSGTRHGRPLAPTAACTVLPDAASFASARCTTS